MDRLAAAVLGPLRREWERTAAIATAGTDPAAMRTACAQLARRAMASVEAMVDLLHAALEAHRPGSTLQAGIDAAEWLDRLQDQIDALRAPDPPSAEEARGRCARLGTELGVGLQRQLLELASELDAERRRALARRLLKRQGRWRPRRA